MNQERIPSIPMPGESQQAIDMIPAGRAVRTLGIADILNTQLQMESGIEARVCTVYG